MVRTLLRLDGACAYIFVAAFLANRNLGRMVTYRRLKRTLWKQNGGLQSRRHLHRRQWHRQRPRFLRRRQRRCQLQRQLPGFRSWLLPRFQRQLRHQIHRRLQLRQRQRLNRERQTHQTRAVGLIPLRTHKRSLRRRLRNHQVHCSNRWQCNVLCTDAICKGPTAPVASRLRQHHHQGPRCETTSNPPRRCPQSLWNLPSLWILLSPW